MQLDDDDQDDAPDSPLLPPDDRLWRHPSEVRTSTRAHRPRSQLRVGTIVALSSSISILLTIGVIGVLSTFREADDPREQPASSTLAESGATVASLTSLNDVASVAERLRSSIVKVSAVGADRTRDGSAVVMRRDGLLLTAAHLVADARRIVVTFDDGRTERAELVGADAETDLALLDIDGPELVVPDMRSEPLRVGEAAIAIGMPAEGPGGQVVSVAMVEGLDREVEVGGRRMLGMVETDDVFTSGCAGGALVDRTGRLTAIANMNARVGGREAGFATPIALARVVADQLAAKGRVSRGWLGIEGETLDALAADEWDLDGGVVVRSVAPGSPAAGAGLTKGDVVVAVGGRRVQAMGDLVALLRTHGPGRVVEIEVVRDGAVVRQSVTLGDRTV